MIESPSASVPRVCGAVMVFQYSALNSGRVMVLSTFSVGGITTGGVVKSSSQLLKRAETPRAAAAIYNNVFFIIVMF